MKRPAHLHANAAMSYFECTRCGAVEDVRPEEILRFDSIRCARIARLHENCTKKDDTGASEPKEIA
jgi:hypothetical protein